MANTWTWTEADVREMQDHDVESNFQAAVEQANKQLRGAAAKHATQQWLLLWTEAKRRGLI